MSRVWRFVVIHDGSDRIIRILSMRALLRALDGYSGITAPIPNICVTLFGTLTAFLSPVLFGELNHCGSEEI